MIDIKEDNLKQGVLGLVMAIVEIIRDALKTQALRRIEAQSLTGEEVERLGRALMDLDAAINEIKQEMGITEAVQSVRDGLDNLVDDLLQKLTGPHEWEDELRSVADGKAEMVKEC
ncbi:MAG: gas vesicle K [Planctomycetes bacterium DG_23]|nr:MAG: gas vesicle K [Planctomycetes bacterium DG_23]